MKVMSLVFSTAYLYLLPPMLIILLYNRYGWVKKVGTVIMAYAVGIILALSGLIPTGDAPGAEQMDKISTMLMIRNNVVKPASKR